MNVLLMIVFIICAAVLYTCYKSAKDLEKNSKLPKAPSEDVKQEGCCGIVECGYWIPLWENGEMRKDRYYCNYKHRLTRAHREKQLKTSCQALHNAPPNRT